MTKLFKILVIFSVGFTNELYAQESEGINFMQEKNWSSVLKKSAASGKPIFVDMYTTWCGPCKVMDKAVFVNDKVGKLFNKNFINVKIDAEKGEGIMIDKKYNVDAYPTFLFINSKGRLFLKHIGSLDTTALLNIAGSALKEFKSPKPIAVWDEEYITKKNLGPAWYYDYIFKKRSLGLDVKQLIEEYLALLPPDSLSSAPVQKMIIYFNVSINGMGIDLLLKMHAKDPYSIYLNGPYASLSRVIDETLQMASQEEDTALLYKALTVSNRMYEEKSIQKRVADMLRIKYYGYCKDTVMIKKLAVDYADNYILGLNVDSLKKTDSVRLREAVLFTFSTLDTDKIQDQKRYKHFIRLFRSESKNRANDILNICNLLCNACDKKIEDMQLLKDAKKWIEIGFRLYPDKKLYKLFSGEVSKCLEKSEEE